MAVMKIPDPLYPCAFEACAAEVSYPADMLHWSNKEASWYCETCALEADIDTSDWSLADEIAYLEQACIDAKGCASPWRATGRALTRCWVELTRRYGLVNARSARDCPRRRAGLVRPLRARERARAD